MSSCSTVDIPATTGNVTTESFSSTIVGDEYLLRIRLPPNYDTSVELSYPLVLQLDPTFAGLQQFDITTGLISAHAGDGSWRDAIVVGVDYPDDPGLRNRDYIPPDEPDPQYAGDGADHFYDMLARELLPKLAADYRIDPGHRYLLGHSNGGVFVWYAALRHDPALGPPLFSGAVAADNGYDEALFTYERWHAQRSSDLPMTIYATRAIYNGAGQKVTFDALLKRLADRKYPSLRLEPDELETDHGGAILPSYAAGLELLLGGQS